MIHCTDFYNLKFQTTVFWLLFLFQVILEIKGYICNHSLSWQMVNCNYDGDIIYFYNAFCHSSMNKSRPMVVLLVNNLKLLEILLFVPIKDLGRVFLGKKVPLFNKIIFLFWYYLMGTLQPCCIISSYTSFVLGFISILYLQDSLKIQIWLVKKFDPVQYNYYIVQ